MQTWARACVIWYNTSFSWKYALLTVARSYRSHGFTAFYLDKSTYFSYLEVISFLHLLEIFQFNTTIILTFISVYLPFFLGICMLQLIILRWNSYLTAERALKADVAEIIYGHNYFYTKLFLYEILNSRQKYNKNNLFIFN